MSWLFPSHATRTAHLDAAVNEALLAGSEVEKAADDMVATTSEAEARAQAVADEATQRVARQELRRIAREKAVRERGVAAAVDDLLRLPSFGGPGDREA
ncbi:hypothetical protein ACLBWX_22280 [Methylobacterium sp. M6A4_1b]